MVRPQLLKGRQPGTSPPVGRRVAVIGGGDAALDAARTARRAGAKEVHILYRRTGALMPARESEVAAARREGVQFHFLTSRCACWETAASGDCWPEKPNWESRRPPAATCPAPVAGSEFTLEADTVIIAVGQTADFRFFGPGLGFDTSSSPAGRRPGEPGHPHSRRLCRRRPDHRAANRGGGLCRRPPGRPGHRLYWPGTAVPGLAAPGRPRHRPGGGYPGRVTSRQPCRTSARQRGEQPRPKWSRASPRPRPGRKRPGARSAPAPSASGTAPFCSTMSGRPATAKDLVQILEERGEAEPVIPYSCHVCGLCETVCPKGLDAGQACLEFRERLVASGKAPLPQHKGMQNYVRWGTHPIFALSRPDPATGEPAGSFSRAAPSPATVPPGQGGLCLFAAAAPRHRHHPQLLRRSQPVAGGAAGAGAGGRRGGRRNGETGGHGNSSPPAPTASTPSRIAPGIKTRSIYEVMAETGLPEGIERGAGGMFNIHDACGARQAPQIHEAVRRLVRPGHGFEEMAHSRERSICCGSGGMAPAVAPALAKQMTDSAWRRPIGPGHLLRRLPGPLGRGPAFAALLELIFNPAWRQTRTQPPPP